MPSIPEKVLFLFKQGRKTKSSSNGWVSGNAPCCVHRGHKPDTRKRGGMRFDSGVVYNCFNCKFTASWKPGRPLSEKFKNLCRWMGANDDDIREMILEALKSESSEAVQSEIKNPTHFVKKQLPEASRSINDWVNDSELFPEVSDDLAPVICYLVDRGFNPLDPTFYWSPAPGYIDRVLIPFVYHGTVVGFTARKVSGPGPKYVAEQPPHFVFNIDNQPEENKFVFVCEGPFDALSIGGVAVLANKVSEAQREIIDRLGKEVIVIPDQDLPGLELVRQCIDYGWSVAIPNWEDNIKDSADAVRRYGKLFVLVDAIKTAQKGAIKINVALHRLEHKIEINKEKEGMLTND